MNIEIRSEQEVRFRCPHCQKLYCTSHDVFDQTSGSGSIAGIEPAEFDCIQCNQAFILSTERDQFGLYRTEDSPAKPSFDTCPKCSALKPHKSDECPSCGALASKFLELQKLESPELYDLNQEWQKVISHFDQDEYHQMFLNKCQRKMALNFAFQHYSELQKTLGFDALCEKYIRQIELRLEQQFKAPPEAGGVASSPERISINGLQWTFIAIGCLGMLALVYNKFIPTFPNFNGLVMMLTVMCFGIGLFSRRRHIES